MTKTRDVQVSIITPALVKDERGIQWLHETIASVAGQTAKGTFEMVIVDDHSPVDLGPLKQTWAGAKGIRWYDATHKGVSAARNQAAEEARAPLLLPLDADDKLARSAVDRFLGIWQERKADIIYSDVMMFGQDYALVYQAPEYHFKTLLKATFMVVGCLHKKADWERVGGWRLDMTQGLEDWEYWIALGEMGVCGQRLPEPLYYYRRHPTGRLQWLKANQDKWDRAYAAMRDLHVDSYNGRFPVGCCGGRAPKGARRPLHGGVPRAQIARAPMPGKEDLIQMMYVGGRRGDFRVMAQPTRTQYHIPGAGGLVEFDENGIQGVNPQDVQWFRSVNQGRDFKLVEPPAAAPPPPPPPAAPTQPAPLPAKESEAWAPEIMEQKAPELAASISAQAQKLAEEHGIDWTQIQGSGKGGNILVKDVRQAIG